jgi:polyphosphate kinase
VQDHDGDMFAAIRQKDMLLHHPYETFDMVIRFLSQAARDPNVVAIKQTLYRTSNESPIVDALCEAAEDGQVGDRAGGTEGALRRGRQYPPVAQAGARGRARDLRLPELQDPRQDLDRGPAGGRPAGHLHPFRDRQLPPDHGARSTPTSASSPATTALGRDATKVFNYVGGYAEPEGLENLAISPHTLKTADHRRDEAEAEHARAGKPGHGSGPR